MALAYIPTDHIVRNDLDPEFIETALIRLAWNYHDLWDRLCNNHRLNYDQKQEEYSKNRAMCAVEALKHACDVHKVPFEYLRLECNGQIKFLVRMGRIILMQETIDAFGDPPKPADYKVQLASTSSAVAQLEFDFGDGFYRSPEWSGCILAVLLHKPAGPNFTEEHKKLGGVTLAIPDGRYSHWTHRFDLYEIAMYGRKGAGWLAEEQAAAGDPEQTDEVFVGIRKKNTNREIE